MSLADDLQTIESNPKYLSATPEQRAGILDKWKDAAANNYSAGDPSLKAALADEAESLLSANQARTRARLTPDVTGKFPDIVPSWGEVLANPALAALPPEKKAAVGEKWRKDKASQLLQMRPSEVEARAFLVDSHMADRTVAGETPDVDAVAGDLSDRLRNAVQVYAEKPVAKTGEFFRDAAGFNVHPSAALATWEDFSAKIDAQDATPEEKIKARAMYGVSRDAAINAVLKNTAAVEQATGPGPGIPVSLEDAPGGVPTGTKSVFKRPGKPDVPYEEFDQAAITQERITRYQSNGGSAEPLLSSDATVRDTAEKALLAQLARHVLPEIDPSLAARVSQNPQSPEAQALVTGFRDNLRARLWVAPTDVKDDFEKARVLSNGEAVWNSGWVAQASPEEVTAAAASTGLKGDALKAAEERGLQQRIDAAQDIVDSIVAVKDGAMIEGPGFRPMPADFREFVAKRAGSDDYKDGKVNAADILNEWKKKSGIVNAGFNAASGAFPQFFQSINLAAAGALTSVLQTMGAEVPALSQWVDDNNTLLNEVQQLSAASETSRGQRIAGQIGKEIPFLLAGVGVGKLVEGGVRRGLVRAMVGGTAKEILAAQGVAGIARSVALGERALASVAELANGTSAALRGYVGLQAARSGTDMYTGAYTKIKENALAQGYSEESAQELARSGAIMPAIAGTAVTAGLMKLMPGGTEALVAKFGESATVAKLREKVGVDALKKMITAGSPVRAGMLGAAKTVFTSFGRHALDEAVEEGVDEFLQSAITAGYDKTMTLPKMLEAAYDAALVGGIMGGASGIATNSFEGIQRVRAARQADIDSKREKVKRDARLDEVISRMEGNPESQAAVEELATEVAARKAALEEEAFQIQGFTRASEDDAGAGQYVSEFFETPEAANQFIAEVSARIGAAPAKGKHPLALFEFLVAEPSPRQFQVIAAPKEEVAAEDVKPVTSPEQDAKLAPLLADLEKATSEFFADIRGVAATPAELAQRPSVGTLRKTYAAKIAEKPEKAGEILGRIAALAENIRGIAPDLKSRGKKKADAPAADTEEKEAPTPAAEEPDGLDITDDDKAAGLEETLTEYKGLRDAVASGYVEDGDKVSNKSRFNKLADAERKLREIDSRGEFEDTPERAAAVNDLDKAIEAIKGAAKKGKISGIAAVKAALDKLKSPGARAQEKSANRDLPPEYTGFPENVSDDIIADVRALYKKLRSIANKVDGDAARIAAKDRLQKLLDNPPGSSPAKEGAAESNAGFVAALDELRGSKQFKGAIAADTGLTDAIKALRGKLVPGRPKAAKRAAPAPKAATTPAPEKPKGKPGRPKKEEAKGPVSSKLSGVSAVAAPDIVRDNVEEAIRTITDMVVEGKIPLETVKAIQKSRSGKRETVDDWWKLLTATEQAAVADALEISVVNAAPGRANRAVNAFLATTDSAKQKDPRIQAFLDFYKEKLGLSVDAKLTLADVSQMGSSYLEQQRKGPPETRKSIPEAIGAAQGRVLATQGEGGLGDFIQTAVSETAQSLTDAVELHMKLWSFARIYAAHEASLAAPENADAKAGLDFIIDTIREAYSANNFKFDMTSDPQKFMDRVVSYVKGDFSLRFPGFSFLKADGARIAALDAAQNEVGSGANNKIMQAAQRLYVAQLSPEEKAEYAARKKAEQVTDTRPESRPETATAEPAATEAQTKRSTKEAEKLGLKSGDVKSLRAALTSIADDTTRPQHLRNLAKFLADSNAVGAIRSFNVITDPEGPAGFFDPRTGEMSINLARPNTRGVADVVAHELTHALADGYLSKKWPAGSPEAKIVDGLRATYEEARAAVQKLLKEKNLKTLRNDLLPKMAAQLTALTSLRKKRKALHKAKLRGTSIAAAQYAPSLSQDEVDQMYFNMARETNGIHAFEEQIDDFAYALALDPVTGDPLLKGLAGQPFNNANGISTEFLTHAWTDAKFQLLLNTMNQPAGADTFLTRAWSAVEKMLRIKHPQPASRVDAMYTDLAELFGDTHVVDAMEAPSAPPVILGPIMAPFRTSAENIEAAIRPWATKAGIGVLAPIEVEVLPADYSPAIAPDSETKPENTNESETSTSEETPTIPPGPERQEGSGREEGLLTADDQAARVNSRAASPIVTGENGVANLAVPADMLRRMSEGNVTDADNALLDEAAQEIAAFREHAFWSLEPYASVDAEYMAAGAAGDTAKLEELVAARAKATGHVSGKVYHGSPNKEITEFVAPVYVAREKFMADMYTDGYVPHPYVEGEEQYVKGKTYELYVAPGRLLSLPDFADWVDVVEHIESQGNDVTELRRKILEDIPNDAFFGYKFPGFTYGVDDQAALAAVARIEQENKARRTWDNYTRETLDRRLQHGAGSQWNWEGHDLSSSNKEVDAAANFTNKRDLVDLLFSYGYDTLAQLESGADPVGDISYIVKDPRRIKSADPVTYDESGNVIPLSERFSPDSADIRYSRAAAPIDTFTLTDAPDWVVKTLTSGGLYAGLDKPALGSILKFGHEQLKTQPKAWANAASTRERTAMTWHYNKVVKKLIARNKPSEQSELAFAQSMLRRLNGTDNYSGKQPGEIYGMTTSFSPTDARLLDVLADAGIRKRSRVAGVDAVFTPAAQRVDADFYELTALMQSVIDTSVATPANPDSTMWMVAVSPDSSFPKLAQRLKQFGYSDAAVDALTAFRRKIQSRYPTVSATALGNMTGMTQLMDDVSRLQTLHRGLALLPPDKQLKRLSEIYSIVEQHGSWIKPMDLAKNKDADSIVLAMGGDAAQQRTAAMQERFLGILGRAAKLVPDSAPLKFLGAGSEAFSFLDKSQGLVYKLMFPRFMSDSVGFGLDMGAVPGKNRRALFDVYHENPLGRSPLRSMLLEEHTQVPGLVDHEIVGITESGALLAVQRAVEGDIYEEDSQQAIFDEWQIQHGAAEFDASSMNAQLLPASLKSAVLTKDALGNYRAVFDIRSANVNVENNAFLPYDALVTPPLPDEVLQSKIIEDAKDEVDQRVHSRASSSVVESGMRVLLRMRKGNFALKQPSSRPNDVLNTVWGPLKNLTRYGGFGKLAHPTVMELRAKEQESLLLASRTLEAVERAIKRSADPDTVRELANAVIGSQDNLYDVPMHDAAMKTWRKARSEVLKEWTKAQRQAEAVGKTTKAGTQILQDAGVKLMTDMDAANTARDSALDDAAQAGAENYAGYQETAKRELNSIDPEVAKAVDKMRRTIDQFSHQLDKAGAITGRLKSVVSRNMGIYLTRTYQIHDDPAYLDLLMSSDPEMQSRMQQAEQYFRDRRHAQYVAVYKSKNPGASDTLANNFADRRMAASGAEMAAQDLREFLQYHFRMTRGAASTGTLNESILLEKTDLPSPLRALLGQQTNNIAAGAVSIMELGRYDANWEFLTNIHSLLSEAELARINRREELRLREASFTDEERKEFDDLGNVMYFTNNKVEAARHGLELFIPPRKNMAKSTLGPLDGFYGPPALVQAMQDLTPPDRGIITQMLAQFTGIAQANLTVYSWRSQIRNIASNMAMPLAAGHLPVLPPMPGRGFADRWIGKMGRVADLLDKATDRDEALTDLMAFYARYTVTGGNASQQVQQDVARIAGQDHGAALLNVYPAAVARGTLKAVQTFGKAAGKASEVLQNTYAFSDDIYKIMLFERELAAYIDSFGIVVDDAGGFTLTEAQATEIIDAFGANGRVTPVMRKQIGSSRTALAKEMLLRESAAAVRDSIAYYDTMPELINKFRRSAGIVAAPFLSFRVAMPMAMLGSFRRARFDMQNPATRGKGITRMVAMAAGFGAYTWALKTILKGLYLAASAVGGGDDDKREVAAFDAPLWWANKEEFALRHLLGDYYRNRDIAYLGINSNGDPIYVDLSWLNPTSQIRDLIVPIMNPSAWREGQTGPAFRESLSRLAEPFITPQILVDAFAKTSMKDDLEASFDTKLEAFGKGVISAVGMALTPGTVSDIYKTGKAVGTQRQNEEIISSVFGIKVKTVDVAEQLNRDLKAGAQMNIDAAKSVRALKNKDIPPDVQDAYDETMALRARVFQQMSDKYQAASLFIGPDAALKVLRKGDHGLGGTSIKDIERGTLSPYKPSEVTLDAMRRMDRKHGTDRTEKVLEAIRKQESKPLMPL